MIEFTMEKEIHESLKQNKIREEKINQEIEQLVIQIKRYTNWSWLFVWIGFFVALFSIFFYYCKNNDAGFGLNLLGDFMSGTVASIWSLAGLFFIYVAFLGQKQQLLNQQMEIMYSQLELKYTRFELAGQKQEMKAQNDTLKKQNFENTFFQLLSLLNLILSSLNQITNSIITFEKSSNDFFEVIYSDFYNNLITRNKIHEINHDPRVKSRIKENLLTYTIEDYNSTYLKNKSSLDYYFRNLFQIIKFVDNSEIENKNQYISIVSAQLSNYQQIILFYNCLHENGKDNFKPLIEKYALFKNIDKTLIINQKDLNEYNVSAYGS